MLLRFPTLSYLLLLQGVLGFEKIDINLLVKLQRAASDSIWRVIIVFEGYDMAALKEKVKDLTGAKKTATIRQILMEKSNSTQFTLLQSINNFKPKPVRVESFWLLNAIGLEATKSLVLQLTRDSLKQYKDIIHIMEDIGFTRDPVEISTSYTTRVNDEAWGVGMIKAPAWWAAGFDGSNVLVGIQDNGVDAGHPELYPSWLAGRFGWKDGEYVNRRAPYYHGPHGTMMLGHIVGQTVGVAPGAKWIACSDHEDRNDTMMQPSHETQRGAIRCYEFLYCPNPPGCSLKPTILNFARSTSYVDVSDEQYFLQDLFVELHILNGQMPVISVGNGGLGGCNSIEFPADNKNVIGVGAVGRDFGMGLSLHPASGKGPAIYRENRGTGFTKPDIVAPGVDVLTTIPRWRDGVPTLGMLRISGASSATAHVSGAIALLLSRNKNLNYEEVKRILYDSARRKRLHSNFKEECGRIPDDTFPNNKFGWGSLELPDPRSLGAPNPPGPINNNPG